MSATLSASDAAYRAAPPSPVDLLFPDFAAEHAATRRLLARVPDGRGAWRPHPRSRTLGELATHVAQIPQRGAVILTTDVLDIARRAPAPPFATTAALLAAHDAGVAALEDALAAATLDDLAGEWRLVAGPHTLIAGPRRHMLRTVGMSHLVHHRAQLGVYLRLLDVPVPGMYGPSADEQAAAPA